MTDSIKNRKILEIFHYFNNDKAKSKYTYLLNDNKFIKYRYEMLKKFCIYNNYEWEIKTFKDFYNTFYGNNTYKQPFSHSLDIYNKPNYLECNIAQIVASLFFKDITEKYIKDNNIKL